MGGAVSTKADKILISPVSCHAPTDEAVTSRRSIFVHEKNHSKLHFMHAYEETDIVLGSGAKSVVKQCHHRSSGLVYAAKIIHRDDLFSEDLLALRREAKIIQSLDHPNIIKFVDYIEDRDKIYLIMEQMDGGQLLDRIAMKNTYTEFEARHTIKVLLNAVKHLHDHCIVHRDLKLENVLLSNKSDEDSVIKIADFGFAVKAYGNVLTTECGSACYIAPEILEERPYGKAVDMWSLGVIAYILLAGYPPFCDENQGKLFRKIKRGQYDFQGASWSTVSEEAINFVKSLLVVDENIRVSADVALNHPWLGIDDSNLLDRNLMASLENIKDYNSVTMKKFRKAVHLVIIMRRWQRLVSSDLSSRHGV
jgi:calcium/calmodulin-dependent protein kinase I